jgi:hypothetical protein
VSSDTTRATTTTTGPKPGNSVPVVADGVVVGCEVDVVRAVCSGVVDGAVVDGSGVAVGVAVTARAASVSGTATTNDDAPGALAS